MSQLQQHIVDAGYSDKFLLNGAIVIADEDMSEFVYFLNEDLFTGQLSNTRFRSDRKSPG